MIGKAEDLATIVELAMVGMEEIKKLEVDLSKAESRPTTDLINEIEKLRLALEYHINREAKEAEKAAA